MSAKRKPDAASFKIAQEIVKKYDSEYTLVSLIAEAITAGHPAPAVEAVGEMWSPEDAVEDATPRASLLERAASWKESDLRKFPTATLELIDALAEALRAASTPLNSFVANLRMRAKRISYSPVQASAYLEIADELEAFEQGI